MNGRTSWLYMATARAALFDELVKIGEAAPQDPPRQPTSPPWKRILGTSAAIGLGTMTGDYVAGKTLPHLARWMPPPNTPQGASARKAVKIILPILGGAAFYMNDRAQRLRREELSKVRNAEPTKTRE